MSGMDRVVRFERELPDILVAIAAPRVPEYVDDLLALTAGTRQRRRWTFPERWLPMGVIARRPAFFPTVPWRTLIAAAVLIALLAAALFVAGSQKRLPPPFGPAANGSLVYSLDGDIYARSGVDGVERLLIGGTSVDFGATFSRDGTKLLFLRLIESGTTAAPRDRIALFSADPDGTNVRDLTGGLFLSWWDASPDDRQIVIQADNGIVPSLYIVDVGGTGAPRRIDVGVAMQMEMPSWMPDGREIVFRGITAGDKALQSAIFAVRPDGSGLHPLTALDGDIAMDYQVPRLSPDGTLLAYTEQKTTSRFHIRNLSTGLDRRLEFSPTRSDQAWPSFSPDGTQILFTQWTRDGAQLMLAPVDGSAAPVPVGLRSPLVNGDPDLSGGFSPDGSLILAFSSQSRQMRVIDAHRGGEGTVMPWTVSDFPGWQRVAK
jgi:Tol biopolymer transport system component